MIRPTNIPYISLPHVLRCPTKFDLSPIQTSSRVPKKIPSLPRLQVKPPTHVFELSKYHDYLPNPEAYAVPVPRVNYANIEADQARAYHYPRQIPRCLRYSRRRTHLTKLRRSPPLRRSHRRWLSCKFAKGLEGYREGQRRAQTCNRGEP